MAGAVENIIRGAILHGLPGIHDQHFVADTGDNAQVMGDHDDGGIKVPLQFIKQRHDLCLYSDVQSGCRFISNEQLWTTQ